MGDYMILSCIEVARDYKIKINLKEVMRKKQINRNKLCYLTGLKLDTINRYYFEKLDRVDLNILKLFCLALHCKISDLLILEEIKKS